MCVYQVLSNNCNGYIVHFKKCNHFQIAFGTTVLSLLEFEYEDFKTQVEEVLQLCENDGFPTHKSIQLETFSPHIQLLLSFMELLQLYELIEEANVMAEIETILTPNNNFKSNFN